METTNGGAKMHYDILILFLLAVACVAYGIWKYNQAEMNDYAKAVDAFRSLKGDFNTMKSTVEDLESENEDLKSTVERLEQTVEENDKEVDALQTHCAKLREGQVDLRDRSYPRTINFKVQGPKTGGAIPIEIIGPTKVPPHRHVTKKKAKVVKKATAKKTTKKKATKKKVIKKKATPTKKKVGRPRKTSSTSSVPTPPVARQALGRGMNALMG